MSYLTFMFLGFLSMILLMILRRNSYHLTILKAFIFALYVFLLGVIGCKLLFILENWEEIQLYGVPWKNGFSFFGPVFLVPLVIPILGKTLHLKSDESTSAAAALGVTMLSVIRIGCYFNDCCGGNKGEFLGRIIQWPTQWIECAGGFLILIVLILLDINHQPKEISYPIFLISYGVLRFFVEFLRATPKVWFIGFSNGQIFSLLSILWGTLWMLCVLHKNPQSVKA